MSDSPPSRASRQTSRPVGEAKERFLRARAERYRAGAHLPPLVEGHERDVWTAIRDGLIAYHAPENWRDGQPIEAISPEIAMMIADAIGEVLTRGIPATWRAIAPRGHALTPTDCADLTAAVRYILAARQRVVLDRSPVRTVAVAFDVDRRTVGRWLADRALAPAPLPDSGDHNPRLVSLLMWKGAERYRARSG